jgi:hypothetical protein
LPSEAVLSIHDISRPLACDAAAISLTAIETEVQVTNPMLIRSKRQLRSALFDPRSVLLE